jgi:hypothetical protein
MAYVLAVDGRRLIHGRRTARVTPELGALIVGLLLALLICLDRGKE